MKPDSATSNRARVRVRRSWLDRSLLSSEAWAAFCAACGKKLSDYDWTAEESRQLGEAALHEHDCPRDPQLRMQV